MFTHVARLFVILKCIPQDTGIGLANTSFNSTIDELMNSPPSYQYGGNNVDSEMVKDARLTKCMDDFDPEAFLNSIDSI